jgi:RimJ/RimL family protein N-acetyltransferase
MSRLPPESVKVGAVTIRRWLSGDTAALHEMIESSLDHLRPWMPWVRNEPLTSAERAVKISSWVEDWDVADDLTFAIVDTAGALLGVCGLHRRIEMPDGLEIGYWVRSGRTGEGIATGAVRALVDAAFSIDGITWLEIHHDLANSASARVAEKVGFIRVCERPDEPAAASEVGVDVTWRLQHRDLEIQNR